jgi:hypothetical protein
LPGDLNLVLKLARRIFLGLIAQTAVAVACGSAYQAAMEARDDRRYPAPGKAHFIHLTEPDLIVDSVAQVVSAVREAR